jgi:hypothetical protein
LAFRWPKKISTTLRAAAAATDGHHFRVGRSSAPMAVTGSASIPWHISKRSRPSRAVLAGSSGQAAMQVRCLETNLHGL